MTVDREDAIAEYDAFGPWVARVTSAALVPPLFRAWAPDPATVEVMVKVPRNVHRRETHAGADLYDHVLWVAGGTLTQLTRAAAAAAAIGAPEDVEGGVLRRQVPLARVVAVEDAGELLDAVLTLRMDDGTALAVRYSGTSRPVMGELVAAVRASWRPAALQDGPAVGGSAAGAPVQDVVRRGGPGPLGGAPVLRLDALGPDVALVAEQRDLQRAEPGLVLLAAHGRRTVALDGPGFAERVRESVQPWVLHGAVALADAHELVLLHRRAWVTRTRKPELSMARTILPLDRVRRLTPAVEPRPSGYAGVVELVLGRGAARILVPTGEDMERALAGLLVARAVCGTLDG